MSSTIFETMRDCTSLQIYDWFTESTNKVPQGGSTRHQIRILREIVLKDKNDTQSISNVAARVNEVRTSYKWDAPRETTDEQIEVMEWDPKGDFGSKLDFFMGIQQRFKAQPIENGGMKFAMRSLSVAHLDSKNPVIFVLGAEDLRR